MEDRQKIIAKLVKIKALAERGVGGERQTAQQMYEALKRRYGITDEEVNRAAVPVDISGIDLKKFWGISFRMALIVYSLNEEQKRVKCADKFFCKNRNAKRAAHIKIQKACSSSLKTCKGSLKKQQWRCSTWQQGNPESQKHRRANIPHCRDNWDI